MSQSPIFDLVVHEDRITLTIDASAINTSLIQRRAGTIYDLSGRTLRMRRGSATPRHDSRSNLSG
jgi:hypothetical protein